MRSKLFISHASADEKLISLFVDYILVAGSGVKLEDIVYTTRDDTGVVNGEDIPEAIKEGIMKSKMFFMMVSEHYKKSEVCLNEMGAAWMDDDLERKIILLPGVGFDRLGWLVIHNKATMFTDAEGLDSIHDQIVETMSTSTRTSTWNRNKALFMSKVNDIVSSPIESAQLVPIDNNEELDWLDIKERFDYHMGEYSSIMNLFTTAINDYTSRIKLMTQKLIQLRSNPKSLTTSQVRGVFLSGAHDTDSLSEIFENKSSDIRYHFDEAMKYAIMLQKQDADKEANRVQCQAMIDSMISLKDEMKGFRETLNEPVDLDKSFRKAQLRLGSAVDFNLEILSFCIARAGDLKMA